MLLSVLCGVLDIEDPQDIHALLLKAAIMHVLLKHVHGGTVALCEEAEGARGLDELGVLIFSDALYALTMISQKVTEVFSHYS